MQLAALLLTALVAAPAQAQTPARSPDALARALQQRYERIRDFSADFAQVYQGGTLRTQARERGTVVVKKPGLMRWRYTDPEKKEIVSDGRTLFMFYPADKQVIESEVPAAEGASTGAMFLAGKGDVSRDFTAAHAESAMPGTVALKLTPRLTQPDYEYLIVTIDPASLQIRALTTLDRLGGENTLTFTNLKENTGVSEREFVFHIPRGVTVSTPDGTRK